MSRTTPKSVNAKRANEAATIIVLLHRKKGASLAELMKVIGWQAHSIRGFLAGTLKRKAIVVRSSREEGAVRRYFIEGDAA